MAMGFYHRHSKDEADTILEHVTTAPLARIGSGVTNHNGAGSMKLHALGLAILIIASASMAQTPATEALNTDTTGAAENTHFIAAPTDTEPIEGAEAGPSNWGEDLITISLDDVEMVDVIRMFSRISQANIIANPSNLDARVTANLDGVEWKPALSSILAMHNQALIEKPVGSGVYSIVDKQPDAPEPLIVKTLFLEYTTTDEVTPVLQSMLPTNGSITAFASRNALVVRSTENSLAEIEQVMTAIDIESKQVCIEAQFMELNDSAIKQLGIRWDALAEYNVGLQAGPFGYGSETTRTQTRTDGLTRGRNASSSSAQTTLYDMYGDQYQVQSVEIVERPDGSFTETTRADPTSSGNNSLTVTSDGTSDISDSFTRTITESGAAILSMDSLDVVISALKQTEGVSTVSNPKIIVANGATNAFFRVGSREPIVKTERTAGTTESSGDKFTTELDTEIETEYIKGGYLHTGIELKVIPNVKTDDLIEAQIEPSLRRKTDTKTVGDNTWPIISVKEIKTRFTLESGQTVAIGGLTDTTDSKQTTKVPLLGSIPLIGKYLFTHTRDVKSQVETIIFVTLTLVNPRELQPEQAIPERAELVHKRMIQQANRKREFDAEVELMRQASEMERSRDAEADEDAIDY
jgi:type IV pilus assembly protein PilQ